MHGLCSEGTGNFSTRLAKCPRDFIEAPSQLLENWCWRKSILERLSKHYQTGASLPDEMLQEHAPGQTRQCGLSVAAANNFLARLDLAIHGLDPP